MTFHDSQRRRRQPEPQRVIFESEGEELIGVLFPAAFADGPTPAVAILGPMAFQKEQPPALMPVGSASSATPRLSLNRAIAARAAGSRAVMKTRSGRSRTCARQSRS